MFDYTAYETRNAGDWSDSFDQCLLDYDARFLRRKVIKTVGGADLLVNLAHTKSLNHNDAFALDDGRFIQIVAAAEDLYEIKGNLTLLAWHIGNRHTPCQIETTRLLILRDKVIGHMLEHLGATVIEVAEPFVPEGGAYGLGRTHSHAHGKTAHDH